MFLVVVAVGLSANAQAPIRPSGALGTGGAVAAPRASGGQVAVIDLAFIYKNHTRFNESMTLMKQEAERFEQWLQEQKNEVQKMAEKRKAYGVGSAEYKSLDEQIARKQSDVEVQMKLKRKDLMEREAKTYYQIYNEIVYSVTNFSDSNGIGLVIRFSRDPIDRDNASSVLQGVNRPVVFQRNLDITDLILKELNRQEAPAGERIGTRPFVPGAQAPAGVRPN